MHNSATRDTTGDGPLHGVRVVVLAGMGPVPFTAMLLADMGAEVVCVSRPAHRAARALDLNDGMRGERDVVNRGIDTVAVDLKDPAGVETVLRLVEGADALLEGYRPGVAERLGLGPEAALARNPALVYVRLTGYGQSGPLSRSAGHDINYVAQSGALHALGRPGEAPRPPVNLLGDYAGGGTVAAYGTVCALLEARASGRGQVIDAAMVDGVALLTAKLQGLRASGLFSDEPGTNWIDSGAPFYDTYRCADGRYLAVGALEPDFYREFTARLGVDTSDWPEQKDRAGWPRLRQLVGAAIESRTRDEWAEIYQGTDSCVSPVLSFEEAAEHPHNAQRGLYQRVGEVLHPAPAPRLERTPARRPEMPRTERLDVEGVLASWGDGRPSDAAAAEFRKLVEQRWSCRAFRPDEVPESVVREMFALAGRSASWCNTQPWHAHVLSGPATKRFAESLVEHVRNSAPVSDLEMPSEYRGVYRERRREAGYALYESLGIAREDRDARAAQGLRNFEFFGAPHVAVITTDRDQGVYGAVDCGGYVANLLLAARSLGVATIPQAAIAMYSDHVRSHLELPEDRLVVCAVSFGYADEDHPVNRFRTSRADASATLTLIDS